MLFLLPIPVSLLLAMLWVAWTTRPRKPAEALHSVQEYQRAVAVLSSSLHGQRTPSTSSGRELVS